MSDQPQLPPDSADTAAPSASGILQCLRLLADEAAALHLADTLDALLTAIAVCAAEIAPGAPVIGAPHGAVLH